MQAGSALPRLILLQSRPGAAQQAHRLPAHCGVWCVAGQEDAPFPRKVLEELGSPRAPQASPIPTTGGVLGPGAVQGMGGFSGRYFQPSPTGLTAVIPEDRKICACFSAAAEQLRNVSHHGEPE